MISIWKETIPGFDPNFRQFPPSLTDFLLSGENHPCCIIIPGGGYAKKAWDHEGIQVAEWCNRIGMSAFVLDYRIAPYTGDSILADGRQAVRFVRQNAKQFGIDPNRIGVCGFSAGAHLAGCCATIYRNREERPDFAILGYGVLTLCDNTHGGTRRLFLGRASEQDPNLQKQYSPCKHVTPDCPPFFLWTTQTDRCVPPDSNTGEMYRACQDAGVPAELQIFDHGPHGLGIPHDDPMIAKWIDACEQFLKMQKIL